MPLRAEFRKTGDLAGRKEIAKTEFDHWNGYLDFRKQYIKEAESLREKKLGEFVSAEHLAESGLGYSHVI